MIRLTRINHVPLVLNSDLIEHIEMTPDTVITLTNGQVFMVLESSDEIIRRVADFRRDVFAEALQCPYTGRFESGKGVISEPSEGDKMSHGR